MARFLITGARAPVALDIVRNLHRHGHWVVLADSLSYPLAKHSRAVDASYKIPSPRSDLQAYGKALLSIIKKEQVEFVLPTCEEVFYIAKLKNALQVYCQVLCPDFETLKRLHSKYDVLSMCEGLPIKLPLTKPLQQATDTDLNHLENWIVKREFCRFGTAVLLAPTVADIRRLSNEDAQGGRVLLQEKIRGEEYCTYAIAVKGKVFADVIYQPTYRIKSTASIYFSPVVNRAISTFVSHFCEKHHYTGQVGFDVIVSGDDVYLLECNPRATSGVHLLAEEDLYQAFSGRHPLPVTNARRPRMLGLAMLLVGLPKALRNFQLPTWCRDFSRAKDVITKRGDKSYLFYPFFSLWELMKIARQNHLSIRAASTADIEWDGEELG